jgi:hypothetical protein
MVRDQRRQLIDSGAAVDSEPVLAVRDTEPPPLVRAHPIAAAVGDA